MKLILIITFSFFTQAYAAPRAIVLMIHGLNNKPEAMNDLKRFLEEENYSVINLALTGHHGDLPNFRKVTADQWKRDFKSGYSLARQSSNAENVPLFFVGYSLGAAVAVDLLANAKNNIHFDRMVLLAPAISTTTLSSFIKMFYVFGDSFLVPSMNNPNYRANEGTSVAAYKALFTIVDEIEKRSLRAVKAPALVMMDPDDELVSNSGVKNIISKNKLSNWYFLNVTNKYSQLDPKYHHLIIDENSLGASEWQKMKSWILNFLDRI